MSLETVDGRLYVIGGASRSGKTAWTVKEVAKQARVIVWDAEEQWATLPGFKKITTRAELLKAIHLKGNARLAFVPSGDLKSLFDLWAGCAYYWGRYHGGCHVVAEELADVTSPGKAPGNWGLLIRRGLKRGVSIYAISQRWAEADKTAIGNASQFVCFRMSSTLDIAYVAKRTRINADEMLGLKPLEYVTYDVASGQQTKNKLTFRRK